MEELIAMLEAATEGGRELDGKIHLWRIADALLSDGSDGHAVRRELGHWSAPPPYTTSLDAALTLVPEGRYVKLTLDRAHNKAWVWVELDDTEAVARKTPALALCIAALKARMAIAPQAGPQGRQSKEG